MKYKTLFRVLLKLIGVIAVAHGVVTCFTALGYVLMARAQNPGRWSFDQYYTLYYGAPGLAAIAMGLYFFFGGRWIVDKAIPGNRPYCHECGYDLTGAAGVVCNECGTPFRGGGVSPPH